MSDFVDRKYVALLSPRLDRFKQVNTDTWNFRCPICGDSKKNKYKARGYLFSKGGRVHYWCHNCKATPKFHEFLKSMDEELYRQYLVDTFGEKPKRNTDTVKVETGTVGMARLFTRSLNIPSIESLPDNHPAKTILRGRKIPEKYFSELFYAEDFKAFVDDFWPENEKELPEQDARIVIPARDAVGSILAIQGRTLGSSKERYITIKPNEDSAKIYGLDHIDFDKTIYVLEGPLDSLFFDNALATMDSALYTAPDIINHKNGDFVFVYDNEPRNRDVLKSIRKSIRLGQKVVIWPKEVSGLKDPNDMVKEGIDVQSLVENRIFQGPQAELELTMWERT